MSAIEITGLRASYGSNVVLEGIDLRVASGVLAAVLGASGCGKTTLLRVLAGFQVPDAGRIVLGDRVVEGEGRRLPPEARRVGYVPQEGVLFPHLTAAENVAFGLPRRERRGARVDDLLESVGLGGLGARRPDQLSGGQQQRVALARALAVGPDVVLLDEPFAALDPQLREQMRTDVRAAIRAAGATALLVTHDHEEAFSLSDEVAVLRDGRIVQSGPPQALYSAPADARLAEFLGDANLLAATAGPDAVQTALGPMRLTGGASTLNGVRRVLVRPEELRLLPHDTPGRGPLGTVEDVTFFGHDARVVVTLEGTSLRVVARTLGGATPAPGALVRVEPPETAHPIG